MMTIDEAFNAEHVCYWEYGKPVMCKLTGRYVATKSLTHVEIRDGWFSTKWVNLIILDDVKRWKK